MAFNTALSGIQAASSDLSVHGNNIANVSTYGFKQSRAQFADVYASSAFGSSGNNVGSGVRLAGVSQQFTQGTIKNTNNNLDFSINGQGFFILSSSGGTYYSRAGAFEVDRDGYIVNTSSQRLRGYSADVNGNIVATLTDLQVNTANLAPVTTSTISTTLNLDARQTAPTSAWDANLNFGDPTPGSTSYNCSTSVTVYDSLGNSHLLSLYFIKSSTANQWGVRAQVDSVDVTATGKTNMMTSNASVLSTSGSLSSLALGELQLNNVVVPAAIAGNDLVSTTDNAASAIATVAAINSVTGSTGVTATVNATSLNLGTYTPGTLAGTQFRINGQNIVVGASTQAALLASINAATGTTGVAAAANSNNQIVLTAADGRNIQVTADGTAATATFSGLSLSATQNSVQRSTFNLISNSPIQIAGSSPTDVGLQTLDYISPFTVVFNSDGSFNSTSSESMLLSWNPLDSNGVANGSTTPQSLTVNLNSITQFGGDFAVQSLSQNGYTTGRLSGLEVDSTGLLFGRYTNGQSLAMGRVILANFANVQGLQPQGNTSWSEAYASGPPIYGQPGTGSLGLIQSSSLEESNVQITDELVSLILAQRNFQANAQTIRTEDAVTQSVINLR